MLVVEDLTFGFRHRPLFHGISFTVDRGQLVHLAGPNGAGKSTMMSIVAGLLTTQKGSVRYEVDGRPVDDRRVAMEYLPAEANGLFLKMDAMDNLAFWCRLRGLSPAAADLHAALEPWGLNQPLVRDDFPVEKFSTGMKRRLALARLSLSPVPCWLLDEPLYGLDQNAIRTFRESLASHLQSGGSALVVSHELGALEGLITDHVELGTTGGAG